MISIGNLLKRQFYYCDSPLPNKISVPSQLKMDLKIVFLVLGFCGVAYVSASPLPTHNEVMRQLWPHRAEIRSFVLHRLIGISKRNTQDDLLCSTCQLVITLGFSFLEQGTPEEVQEGIINICNELEIFTPDLCEGTIYGFFPHVDHIVSNRPLTVDDICGIILNDDDCGVVNVNMTNWKIDIDPNKPDTIHPPLLPDGIPTTKILHLTDIHPDLDYVEGSLTDCGKPMCCRRGEYWEEPWNSTVEAGRLGDYNCDLPEEAMRNGFEDAAKRYENEYKFVILGGDYVHHAVWLTTKESILDHYHSVASAVLAAFPNTPVYPIVGNHESHPTNVFPSHSVWEDHPEFDISWVYNTLADLFKDKLTEEALQTFRKAGYYTMVPEPGLRVITLNNNFCYNLNFWIMYEPADPEGQLQWFSDLMLKAEKANEKVMILGHVPPGVIDCWSVWNKQFNAIIDRYQHMIVGQFFGHTHDDDFKIFFDGDVPSGMAYISPSLTAYTDTNPSYKVFHFDGERDEATWEMVDYESFTYNLELANEEGKPNWYKLYSAKETYGLSSLRPSEMYDLVMRMARDSRLFQHFYRHFTSNSDTEEPCVEDACVRDILCSLITSDHNDKSRCGVLDEEIRKRDK